jgi:hypothetical protein
MRHIKQYYHCTPRNHPYSPTKEQKQQYTMTNSTAYKKIILNSTFPSSTLTDYANEHDIDYYKTRGYSYFNTLHYPSVDPEYENLYVVGYSIYTIDGYIWYPVFSIKLTFYKLNLLDEYSMIYPLYLARVNDRRRNKQYHKLITKYILQYEKASNLNEQLANLIADYWC